MNHLDPYPEKLTLHGWSIKQTWFSPLHTRGRCEELKVRLVCIVNIRSYAPCKRHCLCTMHLSFWDTPWPKPYRGCGCSPGSWRRISWTPLWWPADGGAPSKLAGIHFAWWRSETNLQTVNTTCSPVNHFWAASTTIRTSWSLVESASVRESVRMCAWERLRERKREAGKK